MPTLEEIAEIARVSRSTVSRIINGDPNVKEKTRQRVQRVIDELHYQPNQAARSLAGGRTKVVGLVIPKAVTFLFSDPFFPILIQGITSSCNASDHTLMLWLAEPEYEQRLINQIFGSGLIDGVIVAAMQINDPLVQALIEGPLPYILVGRYPDHEQISYIDADNFNGAREAAIHLTQTGRKQVATITGPQNMVVSRDRLQGFLVGLQDRGRDPGETLVINADFSDMGGYAAAQKLLPSKPEAIFAASDSMAIGALRAIHETGLNIPEDIALIGFDDIPSAARTNPPLTTIRQPIFQIGALAAKTLIQHIENPTQQPAHIIMPTELIIRASG